MAGFHIENFGCRAARADGEAVSDRLRAAGMQEEHPQDAQVVVVNTCSVTAEADSAARAYIRRTHRTNPDARITVTGCYAQRAPEELASLPGVVAVVGNSHKALAPQIILGSDPAMVSIRSLLSGSGEAAAPVWVDDQFAHSFLEEAQLVPGAQTRPNLKIQEGCSNRCTFCVIPQTRGSSRSLPPEKVLAQVRSFVAAGGNELVLSGINLGRWGREVGFARRQGAAALAELVRDIFAQSELPRLRLSSIEPMDWDTELIGLMREFGGTRLARHAHLPLQSGSDAVLRRMHRRYRPWHYQGRVRDLVDAAGSALTLGADVMVGFPGETDREFEETCTFIQELPFGYLHLFPFSPRPGTRGWKMHQESPIPASVVEERMRVLRALGARKTEAHRRGFIGMSLPAITLKTDEKLVAKGITSAVSDNFLPIEIRDVLPSNALVSVQITGVTSELTLTASIEGPGRRAM